MVGNPASLVDDKTPEARQNDSREQFAFTVKDHRGQNFNRINRKRRKGQSFFFVFCAFSAAAMFLGFPAG
jgi:hypothetical protein